MKGIFILFLTVFFGSVVLAQPKTAPNNLRAQLTKIYNEDQQQRQEYAKLEQQYGWGSREAQAFRAKLKAMNDRHLQEVDQIISRQGYPGRSAVGQPLDQVAFMVIQQSTDKAVHQKYLPVVTEAANKGELDKASVAILTDLVRIQNGEKQVYGTQVRVNNQGQKELYPIEDQAGIDQRRKQMDLEPLDAYLRRMGVKSYE
ncbi:hypothetical protein GCM10023187_24210 [Nibrella viscosa]|uniref:DUF4142 domain-containing protein n=1 Tax=Nibrella viscosa TaxID=1084524 RepID=A0ABP8KEU3_9BACT